MRTTIQSTADNRCTLSYDDATTGERITREFWAPQNGGYVREVSDSRPGTLGLQVCENLAHRGSTLEWSGKAPLVDLIRREYRGMRRADARFWAGR